MQLPVAEMKAEWNIPLLFCDWKEIKDERVVESYGS
jgi:hypothetical protein